MTNEERNLQAYRKPKNNSCVKAAWSPGELRRFWATARAAGMDQDAVHGLIGNLFEGKGRMHELTRGDFVRLFHVVATKRHDRDAEIDSYFSGKSVEPLWRKIRWLQRQLNWSTEHLVNYCLNHALFAHTGRIDHIRWLSVWKARAIINGLLKIQARERVYTFPSKELPPPRTKKRKGEDI